MITLTFLHSLSGGPCLSTGCESKLLPSHTNQNPVTKSVLLLIASGQASIYNNLKEKTNLKHQNMFPSLHVVNFISV